MTIPTWVGDYIGLPYKDKGRSTDGYDCWGLVKLIYKERLDIELPSYTEYYDNSKDSESLGPLVLKEKEKENWKEITKLDIQTYDVVILRVRNQPMHIGVIVDNPIFVHIEEGLNSIIDQYESRRWIHRIIGFYRYVSVFERGLLND